LKHPYTKMVVLRLSHTKRLVHPLRNLLRDIG
jgi:hypothetical protein